MTNISTLTITGLTAVLLSTAPAFAGEASEKDDVQTTKVTTTANTTVMGAVERSELIPVTDEEGKVYYNHFVPDSDLFDASIDIETVDSYTYEYNGRIYTNKIVTE